MKATAGIAVTVLICTFQTVLSVSVTEEIIAEVKRHFGDTFQDLLDHPGVQIKVDIPSRRVEGSVAKDYNLPVLEVFTLAVPLFAATIRDLKFFEDAASNPLNFDVDRFVVDLTAKEFSIATREIIQQSIIVIPQLLSLSKAKAVINVTVNTNAGVTLSKRLTLQTLEVTGTWQVGSSALTLQVSKHGNDYKLVGTPNSGTLNVADFFGLLNVALLPNGPLESALRNGGLGRFSLQQTSATIIYNKAKGYAVGLQGRPTIDGWGGFQMSVMLHRYANTGNGVVTMIVSLDSFQLSDLIKKLSGVDISSVPVVGTVTLPKTDVVVSTGVLATNFLPQLISFALNPIPVGVTLVTKLTLNTGDNPIRFQVYLTADKITFQRADDIGQLTLNTLVSALMPGVSANTLILPPGFPNPAALSVSSFDYDHRTRQLTATMIIGGSINLIPDYLTVYDPTLTVQTTQGGDAKVTSTAKWSIGSVGFPLYITPVTTKGKKGFLANGQGDNLRIGQMATAFGAQFVPTELDVALNKAGVKDFLIRQPKVQIPIGAGAKGFNLYLSGIPVIGSFSGVTMNTVVTGDRGSKDMALGLDFANTNFAGLVTHFTGLAIKGLSMFDNSMRVGVIVSRKTLQNVQFQGESLSKLSIVRGLTLAADFSFPSNCGSDNICKFCKAAFGASASLRLRAVIENPRQLLIAARTGNINLGGSIVLSSVELQIQVGLETSIGLAGEMKLNNPPITLTGALRLAPAEILIEMAMLGVWERPFGINYLAVGNLIMQTGVTLIFPPILSKLVAGGKVLIGKIGSGKELIAEVYFGLDLNTPTNNYFYGTVSTATVSGFLAAFGVQTSLPPVLSQTGFPNGISASFSPTEMEVQGQIIPAGFKLRGTLNILGLTASVDIKVNPPFSFVFDVRLGLLNLAGGAFKMCATASCSSGPRLSASIVASPLKIDVKVQGYAKLFGLIKTEASLTITNSQYILELTGRLFLFDSYIKVTANYGALQQASFRVYGLLSTEWMTELKNKATAAIKSGADHATKAISDAQRKIDNAQRAYDAAIRTLQDKQRKVNSAKARFNSAMGTLANRQRSVNSLCWIRSCGQVCIGCPGWNGCCRRVWGGCIGCPSWNHCCSRVTDPICASANAVCQGLRHTAYAALHVAKVVVAAAKRSLDVANGALSAAKAVVNNNRWPLVAAKRFLDGVKLTVKAGAAAASQITKLSLGGLINIKKIEFDVKISLVGSGRFAGSIEASFLRGSLQKFSFMLRLKNVLEMAKDLAEKVFPGITSIGRKRRAVVNDAEPVSVTLQLGQSSIPKVEVNSVSRRDVDSDAFYEISQENNVNISSNNGEGRSETSETDEATRVAEELIHVGKSESYLPTESNRPVETTNDVSDFYQEVFMDELDIASLTDKDRCNSFNVSYGALIEVPNTIKNISRAWNSTAHQYLNYKSYAVNETDLQMKEATVDWLDGQITIELAHLNITDSEPKQTRDVIVNVKRNVTRGHQGIVAGKKVADAVKQWVAMSRGRVAAQNQFGLSNLLRIVLGPVVMATYRVDLRTYLTNRVDLLARTFEEDDEEAEEEIERLRELIDELFTAVHTLFNMGDIADDLFDTLSVLKNLATFCSED